MAYTVPRFDPYIYLFGKEKNNEEGKIDVISWRRNISFMCKCGGQKTDNDNEEILFRRGWKKGEGRGNIIWMRIFLAEETKKREGKRGKYVLWEIIQIISNKLEPRRGSQQKLGICKNISIQRGRRAAEVFSDSLARIIINDVRGVVRRKSWHYDVEDNLGRFAACHERNTIHNLSWTSACHDHQPRRKSRMGWEIFFAHWLQRFVIFSLALLFIIGPLS